MTGCTEKLLLYSDWEHLIFSPKKRILKNLKDIFKIQADLKKKIRCLHFPYATTQNSRTQIMPKDSKFKSG